MLNDESVAVLHVVISDAVVNRQKLFFLQFFVCKSDSFTLDELDRLIFCFVCL